MRGLMRTRAFSSSSDDEDDRDSAARRVAQQPASPAECANCARLERSLPLRTRPVRRSGLPAHHTRLRFRLQYVPSGLTVLLRGRERRELEGRVADLEQNKDERANGGEAEQSSGEARLCDSPVTPPNVAIAQEIGSTFGLRARKSCLPEDHLGIAAGETKRETGCAGQTWAMEGWTRAHDAASDRYYYCPVRVTRNGEPVWELPPEGLIISCVPTEQVRSDEEEAVRSTFLRKLIAGIIALQFWLCVSGAVFFEYNYSLLSKGIKSLRPQAART
jgi:hypothetical protein